MKEVEHPTEYPVPGRARQNAEHWWVGLKEALRDCLNEISEEQRKNIVSGCVCATSSTVVPVNEDMNPLSPAILWMDNRAVEQADRINATNHPVLKYCGDADSPEWMIPKVLWIKRKSERYLYIEAIRLLNSLISLIINCGVLSSFCLPGYL